MRMIRFRFAIVALCCAMTLTSAFLGTSTFVAAQVATKDAAATLEATKDAVTLEATGAATQPAATQAATQAAAQPATVAATAVATVAATPLPPVCVVLPPADLEPIKGVCAKGDMSSACLAGNTVQLKMADSTGPTFEKPGDQINVSKLASLRTVVTDPQSGSSGVVVFKLQGGLPATSAGVTAVLYGDAQINADVVGSAEAQTMPATNAGTDPIILRGGAGKGYPSVGQLKPGQNVVADGRNKAGDWVRIRLDTTVAWAFASLMQIGGNVQSLPVLAEQNTRPDFLYVTPLQSFSLTTALTVPAAGATAQPTCGSVPSGLLLQSSGKDPARLLIDDTDIRLEGATVLVRAELKDHLEVAVLSGKATVTAVGGSIELTPGQWSRIRIGGGDGLTPMAPPAQPIMYDFAAVDGAPLGLLPSTVSCTIGLPATATKATVRVGPGAERGSLFYITPDQNYPVIGQAKDAAGASWWKINAEGRKEAWVAQSEVHAIGACSEITESAAPVVVVAADGGFSSVDGSGSGGNAGTPVSPGFAPGGRTIWQAEPGPISTAGTCTGVPVAYCSQLVALTPQGTGLLWRGQELQPYFMVRLRENVYAYAGPNVLGDATLKLTLTLTSPTTFKATQVMVMKNQPGCTDTFTFSGTFLR